MRLVLDASVALAWFLPETPESKSYADRVAEMLAKPAGLALVPVVFNLECAIALRRERNREVLSESELQQALDALERLPLEIHDVRHSARGILRVAADYGLHPSDALYVELAALNDVPLATLDITGHVSAFVEHFFDVDVSMSQRSSNSVHGCPRNRR